MKNKLILTACIGLLFGCLAFSTNVVTKELLVSNAVELNSAIASAKPGDIIVMKDGVWTDIIIDFKSI